MIFLLLAEKQGKFTNLLCYATEEKAQNEKELLESQGCLCRILRREVI